MDNKELKELIDIFENSSFDRVKFSSSEFSIKLGRNCESKSQTIVMPSAANVAAVPLDSACLSLSSGFVGNANVSAYHEPSNSGVTSSVGEKASCDGEIITAPMVGTFYAAPAPDAPPFVKEGDLVKKGQSLCILEAMKMMNEVTAPCDCEIVSVLKSDGDVVSFGEDLIVYKSC